MATEIGSAKDGLKTRLETISGLRVIDFAPDDWREFPAAVIRLARRNASQVGMGGSSFEGEFIVTVMVGSANVQEVYDELDLYMDPLGAKSIEAAIDGDNSLGGSVDDARLIEIRNIGMRQLGGGRYAGADFRVRFVKQVLT